MFTVTILNKENVIAKYDALPERVHRRLLQAITGLALMLEDYIKRQKLEGQVLNHITGKLQGSIHNDVTDSGNSIIGRAYSSGVNYAAPQEYGAIIPDRYPVNAKAMRFFSGAGDMIFTKFARGFVLPERSFMRSSLADNQENIIDTMKEAVVGAAKG